MRKNATKLAAAVLSLAMVMTSVSMPASAAKKKTTKINKSTATLYTNGSKSQKSTTLYVTVGGKKVKATFKSSNTKILTVAKKTGKVTAKKPGKATVTATYKKKNYKCTVTVKAYATSVKVSPTSVNLVKGKTKVIKATVSPSNASNKKVSFKSSNKAVATVSSTGKITAKKAGTAKITVTALGSKNDAKKTYVTVKVTNPAPAPTETPVVTETPAATETPVATVTPSAVATEGTITITTNVTGASITVMDGATVVTSGSTFSGKTYTSEKIKYGTYVVTVTKEGCKDFTQTVVLNSDDVKVDAQLESVNAVKAELDKAHKVSDTTVQVDFTNKIAVPTKDNFSIEGLTIEDVKITDDQKSVILTVKGMELDKTYTVKTKNIVDANGKAVNNGTADFVARKIAYKVDMKIVDVNTGKDITQIKSDGKETAKFVVTLYDDAGEIVKDSKAEVRFTTTAGNFAETKVTAQSGVASNIFTSEISATKKDALVTATVVAADNKELINLDAKRILSMSPVVEKDNNGASLTDVMVETCDRVILYFNKDVNVTDYTVNKSGEKYAYDANKMVIEIADNAGTYETVDAAATAGKKILNPMALAPVKGESKALYAILPEGERLTDNAKTIIKITDKTKAVPTTESKSTNVTDIRTPSMLSVTNEGLKKIKITFSEPVQNSTKPAKFSTDERKNSAELLEKWVIDNTNLSDEKYGASYGLGEVAKVEVGKFNKDTCDDARNVVTITLGKDKYGKDIYFPAGSHSVQGNKIGDWANVTDPFNNLINTQTLDFVIEADETAPTATVKVESPEQFDVKFNTPVNLSDLTSNLKLQQYKDGAWVDVSENPISIRTVKDTDNKEYIVELTKDWTKVLDTNNTKQNYYNFNFRLYLKKGVVTNVLNGLENAEITLDLNDTIMKTPDVTSTEMSKVEIKDNKVVISMSEPVQLSSFRKTTPKAEQGTTVSMPIVQFISSGDKETIQGHIVEVSDHDNQITVEPDKTITTGTWKVVVRNVSDDVGNTSPTLVEPNFVVDKPIVNDDFNVLWVVAVKKGTSSPINGEIDNDNDVIYVKFNKQIKTYGNTANAGATTNYTVNGYSVPTTSKIDSSIKDYNENAVTKNSYSDIVAIHLKENVLTDESNTINISKTLESVVGDQLGNGGLKLLTKKSAGVFIWNYTDCDKTVIDPQNAAKVSVADLQKFFDNGSYAKYDLTGVIITDTVDKTFTLKHTAPVGFNNQTIKELNINTQETGVLEIKDVTADKITINAPNADVKLTNVKATTVDVKDVLDGSLILDGNTNVTDLNVTDANAGAVEVASNAVNITNFTVNTTGNITLKVDKGVGVSLPEVLVKKACKLYVQNAGTKNVTIKVNEDVKLDDMKITGIAAVAGSSNIIVKTYDSSTKDYKTNTEIVKEEVKGATFSTPEEVAGKNEVSAPIEATAAKTEVTVVGSDISGTGNVTVRIVEGDKLVSAKVELTENEIKGADAEKIKAVGDKIAKATFTGYDVAYKDGTLTFTSKVKGAGHKFDVYVVKDEAIKGLTLTPGTPSDGTDYVPKGDATPGTSKFTVKQGSEIAGTVNMLVNGTEITTAAAIDAGDSASKIATKIVDAINKDETLKDSVKAEVSGATVIITSITTGDGSKVNVTKLEFTVK